MSVPFLLPRWDLRARALPHVGVVFRQLDGVDSHDKYQFRGSITRPAHSLFTLRKVDYSTATQDSLPDGRPTFPGGAGYPLGPNERFQVISSPFPRLLLAHPNLNIKVGQAALSKSSGQVGGQLF
jgi:hypothetical protein